MSNIHGIILVLCMENIYMVEYHRPIPQYQRRLNSLMKQVVRKSGKLIRYWNCISYLWL